MSFSLYCDHCGCEALTRDADAFVDGEGDRCESCGLPGGVSCDSETPAEWRASEEPEDICLLDDCSECNERRGQAGCGWAFDAGIREAERDRAQQTARLAFFLHDVAEEQSEDDVSTAVAAERERCAELHGLLLQVAPWIGGVPFHPDTAADVAAAKRRIYEIIEGAPAPREG